MNTRIVLLSVLSFLLSPAVQAASEQIIWGKSNHYFSNPKSDKNKLQHQVKPNVYQLKRIEKEDGQDARHTRYQILYKNIPVLGHELIAHSGGSRGDFITGVDVTGIEDDVPSLNGKLSAEVVEQKIVAMINDPIVFKNTEKVIFLDSTNKAHLAYEVLLYTNSPETTVAEPHYIVDANSGSVLKEWNGLNTKKIGQGLGGNVLVLPYRGGLFHHGDSQKDIPSLGKFNVTVKGGNCFVETPNIRVINVNETSLNKNSFPVLSIVEMFTKLPTFSYPCNEQSKYVNKNDGNTAPANYSFSAVNDTMYFADVTFDMYKNYYGESRPLGDDLPLRAYTHVKHLDNAFAIPQVKVKGITIMHQQIVIGDGDNMLTAPAQGTIAHELSHNFTRLHSNLV